MLIKKVRFKNGYKRFRDLTIDLGEHPARLIALVDPNGCGKSSVLDGLLFHASAHGQIGISANRDPTYHSMDNVPNFNYQNVEIEFTTGNFGAVYEQRAASGKTVTTLFSFRSPYRYNTQLKIKTPKPQLSFDLTTTAQPMRPV